MSQQIDTVDFECHCGRKFKTERGRDRHVEVKSVEEPGEHGKPRFSELTPQGIPVHPQPSFFETTVAEVGEEVVTTEVVEGIRSRKSWDFDEAYGRATKAMLDDGWVRDPETHVLVPGG